MPIQETSQALQWLFGSFTLASTTALGWLTHDRNKARKQLEDNTKDIIKLKETSVTEDRVREIFQKEISPLSVHMMDLKGMLSSFQTEMVEMKIKQAEDQARREAEKEFNMKRRSTDD